MAKVTTKKKIDITVKYEHTEFYVNDTYTSCGKKMKIIVPILCLCDLSFFFFFLIDNMTNSMYIFFYSSERIIKKYIYIFKLFLSQNSFSYITKSFIPSIHLCRDNSKNPENNFEETWRKKVTLNS